MRVRLRCFLGILVIALWSLSPAYPEPVAVRYIEGTVHGYLALRTLEGKTVASGDLIQTVHDGRVFSRLVFHFRDGSIDDDRAVFTQNGVFRLVSDHHIQKGPYFSQPTDVMIEASPGTVTVRYQEKGRAREKVDHVDLQPDIANGVIFDVLKNIPQNHTATTLSYVAATPKPRLVKLLITPQGEDTFRIAGAPHKAFAFRVKVDLGGIVGVIAPLIGKQPADTMVWVSAGDAPAFLKSEGPLYVGGPVLRTQLTSATW